MCSIEGLPKNLFGTIVIDPPWRYNDDRLSSTQYKTMKVEDIASLPVGGLARENGSHLYLWVTKSFMEEGFHIMRSWGFEYKTMLTWVKVMRLSPLVLSFGTGHYFRGSTEFVLFGVKGICPSLSHSDRDVFFGLRREHSRKPDEFYHIVNRNSPDPKIELFSRESRPGWRAWGDETGRFGSENSGLVPFFGE